MGASPATAVQKGGRAARRHLPVLLTLVLGIVVTIGVAARVVSTERRVAWITFETLARDQLAVINNDLQNADALLTTLRVFVESRDGPPNRDAFQRFLQALRGRTAGLRSVGWAPRVTAEERAGFEQTVRDSGLANFQIQEFGPGGKIVRAGDRAEYYPVLYADANVDHTRVLGFDMVSTESRKAAADQAIATNSGASTPPLTLVTMARPRGGIVSFMPVFPAQASQGDGRERPLGVVWGAFEIHAMVENIVRAKNLLRDLDMYVYDPAGPVDDRMVYWGSADGSQSPVPPELELRAVPHWEGPVSIIDQTLVAIFVPHRSLGATLWSWHVVMPPGLGLLLTAMAVAYLWISSRRTALLEALTGTLRDTTEELHRHAEALSVQSRHDALTGLPNRRAFLEELARLIARVQRGRTGGAVLLVDLDRFKPINDIHGHAVGDQVLCEVAFRLRSVVRDGDIAARLGGDEFAVVMACDVAADAPVALARRIIAVLSGPMPVCGVTVEIGASVGISICPRDGSEPAQLLHAADLAMYRVKRQERGHFCLFEPSMDADLRDRARMESEFRRALAEGEIQPYFQPVVRLRDGCLQGFEVLARWHHATRGVIGPDIFIPVAEEAGLLPDMTYGLLRRACAIARHWPDRLFLAVNISPTHLKDTALIGRILGILGETGFAAQRLEVEITEAALVSEVDAARTALLAMQEAGMRIALDDFGTGYSNLALLRQLSFDKIKIDRSFVLTMRTEAGSAKIVEAIVTLSRSFGVVTTAEGIESAELARDLAALGCEQGQGYYFGRPMPAVGLSVADIAAGEARHDAEAPRVDAEG